MTLSGLPPDAPKVGSIEIVLYMDEGGIGTAFGHEGISIEAAIGYLTVVLDRMRDERKYEWSTCPDCGRPWAEHGEADEDDEEDEDGLSD